MVKSKEFSLSSWFTSHCRELFSWKVSISFVLIDLHIYLILFYLPDTMSSWNCTGQNHSAGNIIILETLFSGISTSEMDFPNFNTTMNKIHFKCKVLYSHQNEVILWIEILYIHTYFTIIYSSASCFYNYYGPDFGYSLYNELRATLSDVVIVSLFCKIPDLFN